MYTHVHIAIYIFIEKNVYSDGVFPCLPHVHPIVENPFRTAFCSEKWWKLRWFVTQPQATQACRRWFILSKIPKWGYINWHWYASGMVDIYTVSNCIKNKPKKTPSQQSTEDFLEVLNCHPLHTWYLTSKKKVLPNLFGSSFNICFWEEQNSPFALYPAVGSSQTLGLVQCVAFRNDDSLRFDPFCWRELKGV